ncbi:hypothetical protein KKF91_15560 [Myxococcota bacterium]|nr:hypothetical protein [Myxococcota bacterium]
MKPQPLIFLLFLACSDAVGEAEEAQVIDGGAGARPQVEVQTNVSSSTVNAGESVDVTCQLIGEQNSLDVAFKVLMNHESISYIVDSGPITLEKSGVWSFSCVAESISLVDSTPEDVLVLSGRIDQLKLRIVPELDHYITAQEVTIISEIFDKYGNIVNWNLVDRIKVSDQDQIIELEDGKYTLVKEGILTFSQETLDVFGQNILKDHIDIIVDESGPKINVLQPKRGADIFDIGHNGLGQSKINVQGFLEDLSNGQLRLIVNHREAIVNSNGFFEADVDLNHGLNSITLESFDRWGNSRRSHRAVFYSGRQIPSQIGDDQHTRVEGAAQMFLAQAFIDDGDHEDPPDDLATLMIRVMASTPMAPPGEILSMGGGIMPGECALYGTSIAFGAPQINMMTEAQGLYVEIKIPQFYMGLRAECCTNMPWPMPDLCEDHGGAMQVGLATLLAHLKIEVNPDDGGLLVSVTSMHSELDDIDLDANGFLGDLIDPGMDLMIDLASGLIEDQFGDALRDALPEVIQEIFESFTSTHTIEIPSPIDGGESFSLDFMLNFNEVITDETGILISLDAIMSADGVSRYPLSTGAITARSIEDFQDQYQLPRHEEFEMGLNFDLLNSIFHHTWLLGAFSGIYVNDDGIHVDFELLHAPVVVSNPSNGEQELQIGDAHFIIGLDMSQSADIPTYLEIDAYFSTTMAIDASNEASVGLLEPSFLEYEIVGVRSEGAVPPIAPEVLLERFIFPPLIHALSSARFALPPLGLDASTFDPSQPPGLIIGLTPSRLACERGHLFAAGRLEAQVVDVDVEAE